MARLQIAEHRFSDIDSVFISIEYDLLSLAVGAIVVDNANGHDVHITVTGPLDTLFEQDIPSVIDHHVSVAGIVLSTKISLNGDQLTLPPGWTIRSDVT